MADPNPHGAGALPVAAAGSFGFGISIANVPGGSLVVHFQPLSISSVSPANALAAHASPSPPGFAPVAIQPAPVSAVPPIPSAASPTTIAAGKRRADPEDEADEPRKKVKPAPAASTRADTVNRQGGGKYSGAVNAQKRPHGLGTDYWADQTVRASGSWSVGKLHGWGLQWDETGKLIGCGVFRKGELIESRPVPRSMLPVDAPLPDTARLASLLLPHGGFYCGALNGDEPHGPGTLHRSDGSEAIRGDWVNGRLLVGGARDAAGRLQGAGSEWSAVGLFEGEFVDGQRTGRPMGSDRESSQMRPLGQWPTGREEADAAGQVACRCLSLRDGSAAGVAAEIKDAPPDRTLLLPSGGHYVGGRSADFRPDGDGIEFGADNSEVARGLWKDNKFHRGHGTKTYVNQSGTDRYIGDFDEAKKVGLGTYFFADGRVYEGEWADGRRNGLGVLWDKHQKLDKCGRYANDAFVEPPRPVPLLNFPLGTRLSKAVRALSATDRERTLLLPDGGYYVGLVSAETQGVGTVFRTDGKVLASGFCSNGQLHGLGISWNERGKMADCGRFEHGQLITQCPVPRSKLPADLATNNYGHANLLLPGGGSYVGQLDEHDQPQGQGVEFKADGSKVASGEWHNGEQHNRGSRVYPGGHCYDGNFVLGQRSGLGAFTSADGRLYEGEWMDGKRRGLGVRWDADGDMTDCGRWANDKLVESRPVPRSKILIGKFLSAAARAADPERTLLLECGGHYVGAVQQGQPKGQGKEFRANGDEIASGQWLDGKLDGIGAQLTVDSDRCEGHFVDGKLSGLGAYTFQDGAIYGGEFKEGASDGLGVEWDATGNAVKCGRWEKDELAEECPVPRNKLRFINDSLLPAAVRAADPERALLLPKGGHYVGDVQQGWPHGKGQAYRRDGLKEAGGDWEEGKLHGEGVKTQPSGDHYEGNFVAGEMSGIGSLTEAASGILYEGEFAADKRSGFGVCWSKAGKLIQCGRWDDESVEPCPVPRSKIPNGKFLSAAAKESSLLFPDGRFYRGELNAQFQRHGAGSMHTADRTLLEIGQWLHDVLQQPSRKALIIGNNKYAEPVNPLKCCVNDAEGMRDALVQLDFECTLLLDAKRRQMTDGIRDFLATLELNDVVFLYFSGHGAEHAGITYLLPTDFGRGSLEHDGVSLNDVMRQLNQKDLDLLNIVVLDCCRANRKDDTFKGGERSRGADEEALMKGISSVRLPSKGQFFIAYPSDPGTVAFESSADLNGYFTGCLLPLLRVPGLKLTEIFINVNEQLEVKSSHRQRSWQNMSLKRDLVLFGLNKQTAAASSSSSSSH